MREVRCGRNTTDDHDSADASTITGATSVSLPSATIRVVATALGQWPAYSYLMAADPRDARATVA
jgi:hypothetical protein